MFLVDKKPKPTSKKKTPNTLGRSCFPREFLIFVNPRNSWNHYDFCHALSFLFRNTTQVGYPIPFNYKCGLLYVASDNHSRLCVLQNTFQGLKKVGTTQSAQCCVPLLDRNETKELWWNLSGGCHWEITCQAIRSLSLFSFSVSSGWCLIYSSVKKALDKIINKYSPSFWQVKKSSINPQSPAGDHNIGHQRGEEHAWSSGRCCWW